MSMLQTLVRGKKAADRLVLTMEPNAFPRLEVTMKGVTHYRTVGWHQLLELLDQSVVVKELQRPEQVRLAIPELPEHTLFVDALETLDGLSVVVTGYVPSLEYPFVFEGVSYLIKVPTIVYHMTWNQKDTSISQFRLAVTPDETASGSTALYRWPFSNVNASGLVCWSAGHFSCELKDVVQKGIFGFLQTPNNRDLYGLGTSHNAPHRDYAEFMSAVHTQGHVPLEWLIPQGMSVIDFHNQH